MPSFSLLSNDNLLQVNPDALATACCMQTISMGAGKTKQVKAKGGKAGGVILRDTVARFVFDKLFVFIISKCSEFLATGVSLSHHIRL